MSHVDKTLFEHASSNSDMPSCPKCNAPLQFKSSKSGPFYGCSRYPECDFSKPLHDSSVEIIKQMETSHCPECASPLAVKKGKYGLFIGCTNYPACHYISHQTESKSAHLVCPLCAKGELNERTSRFGKRFYSCDRYPKCKYVLNFEPVKQVCPSCDWPVLVRKQSKLVCPQCKNEFQEDAN